MKLPHLPLPVLALTAALALPAFAATWQTYTYTNDGFTVDFSGTPKTQPMPLDETAKADVVRSNVYSEDGGKDHIYIIGASLFIATPDLRERAVATIGAYYCKTQQDIMPPQGTGAEVAAIRGENCFNGTGKVVGHFYRVGNMFYQVVYSIPMTADDTDAEHFINSFKLTQQ